MPGERRDDEAPETDAALLRERIATLEARVAEQEKVEASLRESLSLSQAVVDSLPAAVFWKDRSFRYLGANQALMTRAGFKSLDHLVGKVDRELSWAASAEQFHAEDQRVLETGNRLDEEQFLVHGDDVSMSWYRKSKLPLRGSDGRVIGVLGIAEDITEHKQLRDALAQSQSVLQLMMDNLPQHIAWKNRRLVYLGCNRRFALEAGLASVSAIAGKSDFDLPWAADAEHLRAADRRVIEAGVAEIDVEAPIEYKSGDKRWVKSSRIPVRDSRGEVFAVLCLAHDITERKRREEERLRLKEELIEMQAARLAELSAPLIPIQKGILAMPLIGIIDAARARQVMETLLHGIHRMRARVAILDITGVRVVDEEVLDALLRVARAARLLGAEVVLTGTSPETARALVELGADLGEIATEASLESGIAYATRRR